ncbi:MAG: carbonic anhydrase family protein [Epsilonproteobacteria bacterium]|nr:carbonic anhydrase family protein [Campylobacterota bacterium]
MKKSNLLVSSLCALALSTSLYAGHGAHWGYTGHEGPEHWGDLAEAYSMCKMGKSQSPINITKEVSVSTKDLDAIKFGYTTGSVDVINNGHTIQVNIANGSSITVDGKTYALKQFHFHTPSENNIEGKSFPLEAHFVHAAEDGSLAVVGLMFEEGKENEVLKSVWEKMPHKADGKAPLALSAETLNKLLPTAKDYYLFNGSLTTPPCSEGVKWMVLKNYSHISKAQVEEFLHVMHHHNNRPIQPVNARKVIK